MSNQDPILALQREYNRRTRESWASYGEHRRRVTDLLLAARTEFGPRLCVLGAGNCNDLDLSELNEAYEQICLVDLDGEALVQGVERQSLSRAERISLVGGCDLSGAAAILSEFRPETPAGDAELETCLRKLSEVIDQQLPADGLPPFDVVASTCLLTQLIESLRLTLGAGHPRFVELLLALRRRHWRVLSALCRSGGRIVLVSDFVSSDTAPEIATVSDREIVALARQLIEKGNFFTGANPISLRQELLTDKAISPLFTRVDLLAPWRWRLESRAYLVTALRGVCR